MKLKKYESVVESFIDDEFEPCLYHVIKAGRVGKYILVFDDALGIKTGKTEHHTKESLKRRYGIELKND